MICPSQNDQPLYRSGYRMRYRMRYRILIYIVYLYHLGQTQVSRYRTRHPICHHLSHTISITTFIACDIVCIIVYDNFQAGMIPDPDREMAGLFSRSEEIFSRSDLKERGGEFLSVQSTVRYHIRYRIQYHIRYYTRYFFLRCLSCFFSAF